MKSISAFSIVALAAGGLLTNLAACSSSTPAPLAGATEDGGDAGGGGSFTVQSNPCVDTVESIYADPGALAADPSARGNIVKCVQDAPITKEAIQAKLAAVGYVGKPATTGAKVYRISYRTERGDAASSPSAASATVYVPDVPRAAKLPVVVASHGSRGQAPGCAASKVDPAAGDAEADLFRQIYPLAGSGYAVIAPDLAGYANYGAPKNPPSAYAQALDVGRSTLDGARALKKLFPGLEDKVVLVGHSQGGHTALSALATADSYGFTTPIVGVAVYAPLWLSQRTWGAVLFRAVGKDYPLAKSAAGPVSLWYHYTQAELLDGPGEGKKLFAADKQEVVKTFVDTQCWGSRYPALEAVATNAEDLFDPAFVKSVGFPATGLGECPADDAVCAKWLARYSQDRPHLTGKAASVPVLLMYGGKDPTLVPSRMKCALDRLTSDQANLTVCVDPEQNHGTIVAAKGDYASDWIASVALGAPAPAACAQDATALTEACATPPPND